MILPRKHQNDKRYKYHPTILKFLSETTTDTCKWLQEDFCFSSEEKAHNNLEEATWNLLARVRLCAGRNFADVLKDQGERQATLLQVALFIAYACLQDSFSPGNVHLETLVHAKRGRTVTVRGGTLMGWLAKSVEVEHLEAKPIHTHDHIEQQQ